jgi:predicted metal-binding protein
MPWARIQPILQPEVRKLCVNPYPLHKKGCPNFYHKIGCPPQAPLLPDTIDLDKPVWVIYNIFDIKSHIEKMELNHPKFSERQIRCCLYWQGKARKQLKLEIEKFMWCMNKKELTVIKCPEAQGVNLTATMKQIGIDLEWPPKSKAYQIVLAGIAKLYLANNKV